MEEGKEKKEEKKEELKLIISVSPHIKDVISTSKIMLLVILALLPVTLEAIFLFKFDALQVILLSVISAVLTEAAINKMRRLPLTITDCSALLTGLLLALVLPPRVPFWIPLIGGFVAIALGKQIFGGLGYNIFNPALVARAILLLSWTKHMTRDFIPLPPIDTVSGATPLFVAKQARAGLISVNLAQYYKPLLLANSHGSLGEVSAFLLLLGGLFLIWQKIIDWRIPVSYIGTVLVFTYFLKGDPIFYILAGGLFLGAFFMATDYVTSPITRTGRVIFGIGCGIVTTLIRLYSGNPEAVNYSILFMNAWTPLIDRYIIPRKFGAVTK